MTPPDEEFTETERPSTRMRLESLRDVPQRLEAAENSVREALIRIHHIELKARDIGIAVNALVLAVVVLVVVTVSRSCGW